MIMIRRIIVLIAIACAVPGCGIQLPRIQIHGGYNFDFEGQQAEATQSDAIAAGCEQVVIENRFGTVNVEPAEQGDTFWTWNLTCWADTVEQAELFLQQVSMQRTDENGVARWALVLPDPAPKGLRGVRSDLSLKVPPTVAVDVENRGHVNLSGLSGTVKVKNRHGDVYLGDLAVDCEIRNDHGKIDSKNLHGGKIETHHGSLRVLGTVSSLQVRGRHSDIEVADIGGELNVDSGHGKIVANDIAQDAILECSHNDIKINQANGNVRASTSHGDINAVGLHGAVDAKSSHGQIELRVFSPEIRCESSHGSVQLLVYNPDVTSINASASHGSLTIGLPLQLTSRVHANADHGSVESAYPLDDSISYRFETNHGNIHIRQIDPPTE